MVSVSRWLRHDIVTGPLRHAENKELKVLQLSSSVHCDINPSYPETIPVLATHKLHFLAIKCGNSLVLSRRSKNINSCNAHRVNFIQKFNKKYTQNLQEVNSVYLLIGKNSQLNDQAFCLGVWSLYPNKSRRSNSEERDWAWISANDTDPTLIGAQRSKNVETQTFARKYERRMETYICITY